MGFLVLSLTRGFALLGLWVGTLSAEGYCVVVVLSIFLFILFILIILVVIKRVLILTILEVVIVIISAMWS